MKEIYPDFLKYQALLKEEYAKPFERFTNLLLEYNQKFNLTAITQEKDVYYKHLLDSVAGEFLFQENARVCEIGSGAGFPSLPLKIIRPDLSFTLVESIGKKCEFLNIAVKELNLQNVTVIQGRAEELARLPEYREKFDVCCARAVARLNTLAEYCMPFVTVGGKMVAYKGESSEEVKEAQTAFHLLGGEKVNVIKYSLPEDYGERSLVEIVKGKKTPEKYPRGRGKERNQPIV